MGLRANDVTWKYFGPSVTVLQIMSRKFRIIKAAKNPVNI